MAWLLEWQHVPVFHFTLVNIKSNTAVCKVNEKSSRSVGFAIYVKVHSSIMTLYLKFTSEQDAETWKHHCISTIAKILWAWLSDTVRGPLHHTWHFQFSTHTHTHTHTHTYKNDRQAYEAESLKAAKVPPTIVGPAVRSELAHNTLHLTPGEKEKGRKRDGVRKGD